MYGLVKAYASSGVNKIMKKKKSLEYMIEIGDAEVLKDEWSHRKLLLQN